MGGVKMKRLVLAVIVVVMSSGWSCAAVTQDMVNLEARRLNQWKDGELQLCNSARDRSGCARYTMDTYNRKMGELQNDPNLYFYKQDRNQVNRAVQQELNARGYTGR
jgi:hypothetical protein